MGIFSEGGATLLKDFANAKARKVKFIYIE